MARPCSSSQLREAALFCTHRSQIVYGPSEFALPGDRARLSRDGDRRILEPAIKKDLLAIIATLEPIDEDFPDFDEMRPPLEDDPS